MLINVFSILLITFVMICIRFGWCISVATWSMAIVVDKFFSWLDGMCTWSALYLSLTRLRLFSNYQSLDPIDLVRNQLFPILWLYWSPKLSSWPLIFIVQVVFVLNLILSFTFFYRFFAILRRNVILFFGSLVFPLGWSDQYLRRCR